MKTHKTQISDLVLLLLFCISCISVNAAEASTGSKLQAGVQQQASTPSQAGTKGGDAISSVLQPGSPQLPSKPAAGEKDSKPAEPVHSHYSVAAVETDAADLFSMLDHLVAMNKDEMARHSVLPAAGSATIQAQAQAMNEANTGAHITQQHIRRHRKASSFGSAEKQADIPGDIPAEGSARPPADSQPAQKLQAQLQQNLGQNTLGASYEDEEPQQYDSYDSDDSPKQQQRPKYQEKPWKQVEDFASNWLGDAVPGSKYTKPDTDSSKKEYHEERSQQPAESHKEKYDAGADQKPETSFEKYINNMLGDNFTKDMFGIDNSNEQKSEKRESYSEDSNDDKDSPDSDTPPAESPESSEYHGKYEKPNKYSPKSDRYPPKSEQDKPKRDLTYPPKGHSHAPKVGDTLGDDNDDDSSDQEGIYLPPYHESYINNPKKGYSKDSEVEKPPVKPTPPKYHEDSYSKSGPPGPPGPPGQNGEPGPEGKQGKDGKPGTTIILTACPAYEGSYSSYGSRKGSKPDEHGQCPPSRVTLKASSEAAAAPLKLAEEALHNKARALVAFGPTCSKVRPAKGATNSTRKFNGGQAGDLLVVTANCAVSDQRPTLGGRCSIECVDGADYAFFVMAEHTSFAVGVDYAPESPEWHPELQPVMCKARLISSGTFTQSCSITATAMCCYD